MEREKSSSCPDTPVNTLSLKSLAGRAASRNFSRVLIRQPSFVNQVPPSDCEINVKKMTVGELYPAETYSPVEQQKLKEFRQKCADLLLTDEQETDAHMIRWLRARNLDVDKALTMLKTSLDWRRENKLDGILEREEVPKEIQRMTPYANLGLDKDGFPVLLIPMGRHDGRGVLETFGPDECFRYNMINCEKVMEMLRRLGEQQGRQVTQLVEIIDLEGYNYRQLTSRLCREFLIRMQTALDANYPELLRYALVINAPKIFHIVFNVLKPFIPKQTLEKVDIYGPEPEKWKKVLAERFPLELIPKHWGGTREGSDEFCSQDNIWVQGAVPISFFTHGTLSPNEDADANLTPATINSRDTLKIPLTVTRPNSTITWRFRSHNHDIGFQVVFGNNSVVIPFSRVQSQKSLQEGSHQCTRQGTYTLIFDNSYSLARSKTVYYSASVIEPEEMNSNYMATTSAVITPPDHPKTVAVASSA